MIRHYVRYWYPGIITSETSESPIESREERLFPREAYAYQFFDREEIESNGETLKSEPKNFSPVYYLGTILTIEEVRAKSSRESTLLQNMEGNGWDRVVKTKHGQCFPLSPEDKVLQP